MKAYEDFAAGPLTFPINGKTYTVPEVGYVAGMRLQEIEAGKAEVDGEDQWRLLLGSAYDEMTADDVPARALARACLAALTDYRTGNRELAEQVWESGVSLPNLEAAPEAATETETPATGEATSTKRPASTSGTTTRKRTKKTAAAVKSVS